MGSSGWNVGLTLDVSLAGGRGGMFLHLIFANELRAASLSLIELALEVAEGKEPPDRVCRSVIFADAASVRRLCR